MMVTGGSSHAFERLRGLAKMEEGIPGWHETDGNTAATGVHNENSSTTLIIIAHKICFIASATNDVAAKDRSQESPVHHLATARQCRT